MLCINALFPVTKIRMKGNPIKNDFRRDTSDATTFGKTTLTIMSTGIMDLIATLGTATLPCKLSVILLSIASFIDELNVNMLIDIILIVIMLNVIMLNVIMLNVVMTNVMMNAVMMNAVMMNAVMLNVVMTNVIMNNYR